MELVRAKTPDQLVAASHLFDGPATRQHAELFLSRQGHHLILALDDDKNAVGFVSGIEMAHPDKGLEMFLYELAVDPASQRQGLGAALVKALASVAQKAGCYDMWVLTDDENEAAVSTYKSTGASLEPNTRLMLWTFAS